MNRRCLGGLVLLFSVICIPNEGTAQEHCNALLSEGLKNVHRTTRTEDWNNYMFHQVCRKTRSGWSVDLGIFDLGNLGIGSSKAEQFCEEQEKLSQGKIGESMEVSVLTAAALKAWNQCQRLHNEKVIIETSFGDTFIEFAVSRGKGIKAKLDAVYFDDNVASCDVTGGTGPTKKISSGQKLSIKMNEEDHHVHCERRLIRSPDGAETVPRAQVTVKTSYGDLLVVLPEEERYAPALASELKRLIAANGVRNDALEKRIQDLLPTSVKVHNQVHAACADRNRCVDQKFLGTTDRRLCFLQRSHFEDLDSPAEWGACHVKQEGGNWYLVAALGPKGGDHNSQCSAQCLTW